MAPPLTADRMLTALRAEGLMVHEHTGWRTHGRDDETGKTFGPAIGVLIHHTAGHNDRELCFNGRPDLPGPLCHAWLGKTDGLWLLGNGRTNHAGSVDGDVVRALMAETSPLPVDDETDTDGNDVLYGLEIENRGNGTDPYPAGQYDEAVRWAAAICRAHGWSERSVAGHKEVQPGKVDPSFDMDVFRAAVAARLAHAPDWNPNEEDDMPLTDAEIDKVADRVVAKLMAADVIPAVAPPDNNDDWDTNKTWTYKYAVQSPIVTGRETLRRLKDVEEKVNSLAVGGVDLDALAAKVADLLAARLAQ